MNNISLRLKMNKSINNFNSNCKTRGLRSISTTVTIYSIFCYLLTTQSTTHAFTSTSSSSISFSHTQNRQLQSLLDNLNYCTRTHSKLSSSTPPSTSTSLFSSASSQQDGPLIGFDVSCVLNNDEIKPIYRSNKNGKEKIINAYGFYTILITLITCPPWVLAMYIVDAINNAFPDLDPNRGFYDSLGKVWAKTWLTLTNCYPTISGDLDRIKNAEDSCLFVANHASWFDIPVLCTVLDPCFKFIAKGELRDVPCIGQQLKGGQHIMIDREDRRSQLRTFKEGVEWLKKGASVMAFPEGMRSPDGKLLPFKGGAFAMAVKAKKPIVPISLSNTHAVYPINALFPVQPGAGKLHVHIHEPISPEGMSEEELERLVRQALLSKMPLCQYPNAVGETSVEEEETMQV